MIADLSAGRGERKKVMTHREKYDIYERMMQAIPYYTQILEAKYQIISPIFLAVQDEETHTYFLDMEYKVNGEYRRHYGAIKQSFLDSIQ